jgi:diguanylate cyclase (GGDEF)-like protein
MRAGRWFIAIMCVVMHGVACAHPEAGRPLLTSYSPRTLNSEDHPVGPQFFAAASDARGVLFVAHNYGISEFDGARWRTWRNELDSAVLSLAGAPDGRLVAGGTGSFGWFELAEGGRWRYRSLVDDMPDGHPAVGDVWFAGACDEGLVYRAADFIALWRADGALRVWRSAENAFHLSGVVDGRFYVREKGVGLKTLHQGELVLAPGGAAYAETPIYVYLPQDDTHLLLVARDGTRWSYDPTTGASAVSAPPESSRAWWNAGGLYSGTRLPDGRYVFGTIERGLAVTDADGAVELILDHTRGLRNDLVFALHNEPNGDVWALLNDGATRITLRAELSHFGPAQGLDGFAENMIRDGDALLVAASNGVFRLNATDDPMREARFERVPSTAQQPWTFEYAAGDLLLGANNGLFRIVDGTIEPLLDGFAVSYMRHDPFEPTRWFVSGGQGVAIARRIDGKWSIGAPMASISEFGVGMHVTAPNELWIGTEQQRAIHVRLEPGSDRVASLTRYGADAGLPKGQSSVHMRGGDWWLGTTKGLLRFDAAQQRFAPDAALATALSEFRGTSLRSWSNASVWRLALEDKLIALLPDAQHDWRTSNDVLRLMPSGGRVLALLEEGDVLWIGTDDGLFRWKPSAKPEPIAAPTLLLTEVQARRGMRSTLLAVERSDEGLRLPQVLPPETTGLRFAYALPDYADPARNRYRTRLEGLESGFGAWSAGTERELSGLRHGDYRLIVEARNAFGERAQPLSIAFRIAAPWYARPWALALVGLLALLLTLWFVRRRSAAVLARNQELEHAVREKTEQLLHASRSDALTGLFNRRHFEEAARLAFERVRQSASVPEQQRVYCDTVGVLLIDLDHFKAINDQYGHDVGDAILIEAARRIAHATRSEDHVMRWGGEEFLVLAPGINATQTDALARRILELIAATPVRVNELNVAIACSVGWTVSDWSSNTAALPTLDDLLVLADKALYLAKREGRARTCGALPGPRVGYLFGNTAWKRAALDGLPEDQVTLRRSHEPNDSAGTTGAK